MSIPGTGAVTLPAELVDFVESGVSMLVGTRDAQLRPEALRASGCIVAADRTRLSLLANVETARRTVANIEAGSPIAITFNRPIDHRTVQVKGRCHGVRRGGPGEDEVARRYIAVFGDALYQVGLSRAFVRRMRVAPCVVVEVEVCELFEQTPGPAAGRRLETRA